ERLARVFKPLYHAAGYSVVQQLQLKESYAISKFPTDGVRAKKPLAKRKPTNAEKLQRVAFWPTNSKPSETAI
ncbi:MAG: hypothetical protein RR842_14210, partial [Gordonibacter sp.]|uniref:hypothetical protein n=1 Tax=Gordonibacter sp. TaxID=1968902 RepID=UPI002FC9257C